MTQQYGQQQPQQAAYGAPGMPVPMPGQQMPAPMPSVVKWGGLTTGGANKIPVICFIGRLTDMLFVPDNFGNYQVQEKYDQVQILESPAPWPWATLDLPIKYSEREESGWGRHVSSAKTLGLAINAASLDEAKADLIGKMYELRQKEEDYGEDKKTGQKFKGDVWRFIRIVQAGGQQAAFPQPQYAQPAAAPIPQPTAAAPVTVAGTPSTFSAVIAPTDTAPVRAKKLLHGKTLNEFLGVALVDDKIKADSAFVNSIFDQSFIVGLKASGQVVLGADGKFNIIS
jgi:hypothetical protein